MPDIQKPLIVIENFQKGIAQSGGFGFSDMRNVDINTIPGLILNSFAATKMSGTTITGIPKWGVMNNDANATVYVVDSNHRVYSASNAFADNWNTWSLVTHNSASTGNGNGLSIFNNFLILAGDTKMDAMKISNSSWTNDFTSGTSGLHSDTSCHPMWLSNNGILYGGDGVDTTNVLGSGIWSLQQVNGKIFDASDASTFTFTLNALSTRLPYPVRIRCLTQLGNNLMIGTFIGTTSLGDIIQAGATNTITKLAQIFPWDKSSTTYSLPITLPEAGINQMLTVGNICIFQAGQFGNYYVTDGTSYRFLFEVPKDTTATLTSPYYVMTTYPGAINFHQGRVYFGITGGSASAGPSGVYSVGLDGKGLCMDNLVSSGTSIGSTYVGLLLPLRDSGLEYLIGWQDASAQGIDLVSAGNTYTTDYSSYVDSEWYDIGTALHPGMLFSGEIQLQKKLASGEGVRVSYRYDKTASFTTLYTMDFATLGAVAEKPFIASLSGRQVQFRIAVANTTAGGPRVQKVLFNPLNPDGRSK